MGPGVSMINGAPHSLWQAAGPQFVANDASAYGLSNECLIVTPLHMPGNGAGDSLRCKQCSRALIGLRL